MIPGWPNVYHIPQSSKLLKKNTRIMFLKSVKIYLGTDFNWTLTFDLDVFFDKSIDDRLFHSKWSKVSVIDNEKVWSDFIEISVLSGAITVKRRPKILLVLVDWRNL